MRTVLFLSLALTLHAREFPHPFNTGTDIGKKPMPAGEAVKLIKMPPGFKATVFAAEPDVQNPIACAWDSRGRLWIAENYTYADSKTNFDKTLRDRILIFEDTDNDGRHDKRTVFADDLQNLTSIELGYGGVFVTAAPHLLFIPDRDGDDRPDRANPSDPSDQREILLDGFDAWSVRHNFINGLRWGPDGWLYGRHGIQATSKVGAPGTPDAERVTLNCGIWRFHPVRRTFEIVCWGGTNPWGLDWNAEGEGFFTNTVIGHVYHLIPGAHYERMYGEDPNPHIYQLLPQTADHHHFDTSKGWGNSRDGRAADLGGGHAHSGCMIYLGENWPAEYRGRLFTLNLHGRRINVERIERKGSGYTLKHEPDMIHFGDPWFRGIELTHGPDGGVYVLDWSDQGECHENDGVHRESGRIYKITHGEKSKPSGYRDPGWTRRMAWRTQPPQDEQPALPGSLDESASRRIWCEHSRSHAAETIVASLPALLAHREDNDDTLLPHLYWSAIERVFPGPLSTQAAQAVYRGEITLLLENTTRRLALEHIAQPALLDTMLALAVESFDAGKAASITRGISAAMRGIIKAPAPKNWPAFAAKATAIPALAGKIRELNVIFGDGRALDEIRALALDGKAAIAERRQAVETLIASKDTGLRAVCEKLVKNNDLAPAAVRGLAAFDDPAAAALAVANWGRVRADGRPTVIAAMCSRPVFARALLDAIAVGKIARENLTAYHARQLAALGDAEVSRRLGEVWGSVSSTSEQKRARITELAAELSPEALKAADIEKGRAVYAQVCASCHTLYDLGQGGTNLGPNLTGSGRGDLRYLLENTVDPNALVPADYKLSIITLKDGRVLSGFISAQNDQTLTLRTMTETSTLAKADVTKTESSPQSLMPEGLLDTLTSAQRRDLFGFLMRK